MVLRARLALIAATSSIAACGGGAPPDTNEPVPEAASAQPGPSAATTSAREPDVILPWVGFVAPETAPSVLSLTVADEDEEIAIEIGAPEGDIDEVIEGVQEGLQALTGERGTVRSATIGGRPGKVLSVARVSRGQPIAVGFAIVELEDGRHARMSHQLRRQPEGGAVLERALASFSPSRPAAPAPGFRIVGIGGWYLEAPTRAIVGRASLMYPDESEIAVVVSPAPADAGDSPLAQATTSPLNTVRRVTNVRRGQLSVLGETGAQATWDIALESGPTWTEEAVEVAIGEQLLLFVRGSRLPSNVGFGQLLATFQRTEPRP